MHQTVKEGGLTARHSLFGAKGSKVIVSTFDRFEPFLIEFPDFPSCEGQISETGTDFALVPGATK